MEVTLDALVKVRGKPRVIINGAQRGADALSSYYCYRRKIDTLPIGAKWGSISPSSHAGPQRNYRMILRKPDLVIAFYSSKRRIPGTKNMVKQARYHNIEYKEVFPFHEF